MNLQTAQLGNTNGISLGGYVPVATRQPGLLDQALASLASSVVGAVAQKGVEGLMTPDMGKQAVANQVQMAGIEKGPDGQLVDKASALQRWFAPRDAKMFQQALGQQQEANYRADTLRQTGAAEAARLDVTVAGRVAAEKQDGVKQTFDEKRFAAEEAARRRSEEAALRDFNANEANRKTVLGLQTTAQEMSDPMNWRNVTSGALRDKALSTQIAANEAEIQRSNVLTKQQQQMLDMQQAPVRQEALANFLSGKQMAGNTVAATALANELGSNWDPADKKGLEAAWQRAQSNNPKTMATAATSSKELQAAADQPLINRVGTLAKGMAGAGEQALNKTAYGVGRVFLSRPEAEAMVARGPDLTTLGMPAGYFGPQIGATTPEQTQALQQYLETGGFSPADVLARQQALGYDPKNKPALRNQIR